MSTDAAQDDSGAKKNTSIYVKQDLKDEIERRKRDEQSYGDYLWSLLEQQDLIEKLNQ